MSPEPGNDVFVVGVGRSGTTLVYRTLQQIFSGLHGEDYASTYEPLIWNHELFDRPYEDCAPLFGKTASLSAEGIYLHQKIPLFIEQPEPIETYLWSPVIRHISALHGPGKPHLAKFIRMSGRLPLLRKLNARAKIVIVVRNPLDLVNSVKFKFSYFGDDFYSSDFARFCREREGKLLLDPENNSWAQRQAEYAYQMSCASLAFAASDKQTLVIDYDQLNAGEFSLAAKLCKFLGLETTEDAVVRSRQKRGPTTQSVQLQPSEFEQIKPYLSAYTRIDPDVVISNERLQRQIAMKYAAPFSGVALDESLEGLTTNRLRAMLRRKTHR